MRPHVAPSQREKDSSKPNRLTPHAQRRQQRISTNVKRQRKKMDRSISRHASSPPVPVLVGPGEKTFYVHTSLLNKSPFFRAALQKDLFKEAQERVIRLPEEDVLLFKCFFEWLYQGEFADTGRVFADVSEDNIDASEPDKHTDDNDTAVSLELEAVARIYDLGLQFQCYALGDKLLVKGFQDHMWDEISKEPLTRQRKLTVKLVRYVYANTMENDRLREFCINALLSSSTITQLLRAGIIQKIFARKSPLDLQADFNEKLNVQIDMDEEKRIQELKRMINKASDAGKTVLYEDLRFKGCLNFRCMREECPGHGFFPDRDER